MGNSLSYALAYFSAVILGVALPPLAIRLAKSLGIVDVPNIRKVHQSPVPRIGGIAIGIATLLPAIAVAMMNSQALSLPGEVRRLGSLIVGAACVMLVGLIDDAWEIPSAYKLIMLLGAAIMFCLSGGMIQSVVIRGGHLLDLGVAAWPVTLLWIVVVTVSINFIDGLDGLAAGIVAVACAVLAVGSGVGGYPLGAILSLALAGALSAFLVYNWHPASVFMGDCGSMFIGFLFAGSCVLASHTIGTNRAIFLPSMALAVPLVDTLVTMMRRGVLQRRSLFASERGHIHHRLLDGGLCHQHAVLLLHLVTCAAATVAIICIFAGGTVTSVVAIAFCLGLIYLFRIAGTVRAKEMLAAIRRNRLLGRTARKHQATFYHLQLCFGGADSFDEWWQQVCQAADGLNFAKIDLPITRRDGSTTVLRWRRDGEPLADTNSITAEIPIPQRRAGQALRASVEVGVSDFLESAGHRLALFSRLMGEFGLDHLVTRTASGDGAAAASLASRASTALDFVRPTGPFAGLRVAIVHDFLYVYAGAERVLEQLVEVFPHAELFSLFDFLPDESRGFIRNKRVTPTFLQHMPWARRRHRAYLPLMPLAIEQLDVSKFDLVISSSYVAAKGVITHPHQLHVCYCHTPARYAWDMQGQYLRQAGLMRGFRATIAQMILHYIRNWDVRSSNGVDAFITNSDFVGRRIRKIYRREAHTIYPPVDTEMFSLHTQKEDYFLTASRMVPYKRMDLVVEAFSRMPDKRLVVIGDGPEMPRIKSKAGKNVTFLGHQPVDQLRRHLQLAKAFVFAAEEDFGIAPLEAQACGTPVIAFGRGGVRESVISGETGLFFDTQSPKAIVDAVHEFEAHDWDYAAIRRNAERFSSCRFRNQFVERIRKEWAAFKAGQLAVKVSPPADDPDILEAIAGAGAGS